MQAQRKFEQTAPTRQEDEEDWSPRLAEGQAGGAPCSPTHLLWDQLAARLQEQPNAAAPATTLAAEAKWSMPTRIATIVGLSIAGWSALYLIVAKLI